MHRVASITGAPSASRPSNAPVGHASTHALHVPQRSSSNGASGSSSTSTSSVPMKKYDPRRGWISIVLRPNQPSPARRASSRSSTGPVSTYARAAGSLRPSSSSSHRSSESSFGLMTFW